MQKGFTLIELLIVMIIVALLVVVSVPKYKTSMEKARAQEGINNLTLIADQANGYYMMQDGSYLNVQNFLKKGVDKAKSNYFKEPKYRVIAGSRLIISTESKKAGYTLSISLMAGQVSARSCAPKSGNETAKRICDAIGWGN